MNLFDFQIGWKTKGWTICEEGQNKNIMIQKVVCAGSY